MAQTALKTLSRAVLKEAALILTIALLSLGGAILFYAIEGGVEANTKNEVRNMKGDLVMKLVQKSGLGKARAIEFKKEANKVFQEFEEELLEAYTSGSLSTDTSDTVWSFTGSLFYVGTVFTTVGYGNIYPTTTLGKLLTIVYASITIPLVLIFLDALGKIFTRCMKAFPECARVLYYSDVGVVLRKAPGVKTLEERFQWPRERPECAGKPLLELIDGALAKADESFDLPLVPALLVLTAYTASGAVMYSLWEDMDFVDAFYFVFITISTIGFGDVLPEYPALMILTSLYVFVGLGVCSMVLNVIVEVLQRQMPTTMNWASSLVEKIYNTEATVSTNIEEDLTKTVIAGDVSLEASVAASNVPILASEPLLEVDIDKSKESESISEVGSDVTTGVVSDVAEDVVAVVVTDLTSDVAAVVAADISVPSDTGELFCEPLSSVSEEPVAEQSAAVDSEPVSESAAAVELTEEQVGGVTEQDVPVVEVEEVENAEFLVEVEAAVAEDALLAVEESLVSSTQCEEEPDTVSEQDVIIAATADEAVLVAEVDQSSVSTSALDTNTPQDEILQDASTETTESQILVKDTIAETIATSSDAAFSEVEVHTSLEESIAATLDDVIDSVASAVIEDDTQLTVAEVNGSSHVVVEEVVDSPIVDVVVSEAIEESPKPLEAAFEIVSIEDIVGSETVSEEDVTDSAISDIIEEMTSYAVDDAIAESIVESDVSESSMTASESVTDSGVSVVTEELSELPDDDDAITESSTPTAMDDADDDFAISEDVNDEKEVSANVAFTDSSTPTMSMSSMESINTSSTIITSSSDSETSLIVDPEASKAIVSNLVGESDSIMLRDIDEYSISSDIEKECSNIGADLDFGGMCLERENTLILGSQEDEEEEEIIESDLPGISESASLLRSFDDTEVFKSMVDNFDSFAMEQEAVFGREWEAPEVEDRQTRIRHFSGGSFDVESEPESREPSRAGFRPDDEIEDSFEDDEDADADALKAGETLSEAADILSDINSILADLDAGPPGGGSGIDPQMMADAMLEEKEGEEDFCGKVLFKGSKKFS